MIALAKGKERILVNFKLHHERIVLAKGALTTMIMEDFVKHFRINSSNIKA